MSHQFHKCVKAAAITFVASQTGAEDHPDALLLRHIQLGGHELRGGDRLQPRHHQAEAVSLQSSSWTQSI